MSISKKLKCIPHNLTKSYFGSFNFFNCGYMADWMLFAARKLGADEVTIDVLRECILPKTMQIPPLMEYLPVTRSIITRQLDRHGFPPDFIIDARITVRIPKETDSRSALYCYPEITDQSGNRYQPGMIVETAFEKWFDPFDENTWLVPRPGTQKRERIIATAAKWLREYKGIW